MGSPPRPPCWVQDYFKGRADRKDIKRLLVAKENKLPKNCFDKEGNVSFGIHEYINVPDLNYDPSIGIMGFQATITLTRPGFRIKNRRKMNSKIGKKHKISQDESIDFFKNKFNIAVEEV